MHADTQYFILFISLDIVSLILQAVGGGQASASAATSIPTDSATHIMVAGIIFQLCSMAVFMGLGFDFVYRTTTRRAYAFRTRAIAKKAQGERPGTPPSSETTSSENVPVVGSKGGEAGLVEERDNMTRWWIFLGGVLFSSIMILVRGGSLPAVLTRCLMVVTHPAPADPPGIFRSIELNDGWTGPIVTNQALTIGLDGAPMVLAVTVYNVIHPGWLLPKRTSWKGGH